MEILAGLTDAPDDDDVFTSLSPGEAAPPGRWRALLVSGTLHALIAVVVMVMRMHETRVPESLPSLLAQPAEVREARRVVVVPPSVLRELQERPREAQPPPPPTRPQPAPPPQVAQKDRISIGAPSEERAKTLILRREDDLTATPKGEPDAGRRPAASRPEPTPQARVADTAGDGGQRAPGTAGLALPARPGGRVSSGLGGSPDRRGSSPSLAASVRRWEERLSSGADVGLPTGTGRQMGPLFFDPEGADFTAWINHFKNEVYRNWIVPQSAIMGLTGRVDIRFVVARNGRLLDLSLVNGSGTDALDRAASNALRGSQLRELPADFAPAQITMNVSFFYNQRPPSS